MNPIAVLVALATAVGLGEALVRKIRSYQPRTVLGLERFDVRPVDYDIRAEMRRRELTRDQILGVLREAGIGIDQLKQIYDFATQRAPRDNPLSVDQMRVLFYLDLLHGWADERYTPSFQPVRELNQKGKAMARELAPITSAADLEYWMRRHSSRGPGLLPVGDGSLVTRSVAPYTRYRFTPIGDGATTQHAPDGFEFHGLNWLNEEREWTGIVRNAADLTELAFGLPRLPG